MSEVRVHRDETFARTPRREVLLGLAVLAVLGIVAWLSWVAIDGDPLASHYSAEVPLPAGAPILKPGADVRVAGRRAGTVRAVTVAADGHSARARIELDSGRIGPGASARVRLRGLAGVVYLDLDRGDTRHGLPSGSTVAPQRTSAGVQLSDVVAGFDRDARAALSRDLTAYGAGVAGHGPELNRMLARLPETLDGIMGPLHALRPRPGALTDVLVRADAVARDVAPAGTTTLAGLLPAARDTLATTGARAGDLGDALHAFPGVEAQTAQTLPGADDLLVRLERAARGLRPGIAALDEALPALERVEARTSGIAELASLARTATPVVRAATPVAAEAQGTAAALAPLSDPLLVLSRKLVPYRRELLEAPAGFTRWGNFTYDDGQGKGHRAVRFSMILTCAKARDAYPAPDATPNDRMACR